MPSHVEIELPEALGDFRIHRLLGTGGSGQVFEASWGPRRVALKILRSDLLPNDTERSRFFSEAQHLSELGHPGIVKILSYGALPDGRPYLVMELLDGEVLAKRLSGERLPIDAALHYFRQIASAVGAIHQHGTIHRDLKPENVMIARGVDGDYAILLDFGIAKSLDAPASTTTQEGGVRGTPAYMAPERFFGQPASIASDIYELSVLLYTLLSSALPWDSGLDPEARLNPKPPSERGAAIPPALETLIMQGLSTRPEARPRSVIELLAALAEATATIPTNGPRTTAAISPRASAPSAAPPSVDAFAPTGHSGRTPGLDPLAHTSQPMAPGSRSLLPLWIAGGVVAIAVAVAAALWPTGKDKGEETAKTGAGMTLADSEINDPSPMKSVEAPTDTTTTSETTSAEARAGDDSAFFTARKHHPAATSVLIGLRGRQLRQSKAFARIFDKQKTREPLLTVVRATKACGIDIIDDLDWITLGIAEKGKEEVDAIISGNPKTFNRDSVEKCLAQVGSSFGAGSTISRDGDITSLGSGDGPSHLIWLDTSTFLLSTRKDASPEWLRQRLAGVGSVNEGGPLADVVGRVDGEATLWLVGRAEALDVGTELEGIPMPEVLWGEITVTDALALDSTLVYPDVKTAAAAETDLGSRIGELKKDPMASALFGKLAVTRDGKAVRVVIEVGSAATQMVSQALIETLKERAP